jgi:hypothetical protein
MKTLLYVLAFPLLLTVALVVGVVMILGMTVAVAAYALAGGIEATGDPYRKFIDYSNDQRA